MVKEKKFDYHDKKPDLETESFRMWKLSNEEKDKMKSQGDLENKNEIKVKIGDFEMNLCGFNQIRNKENKLVYAYKIKQDKSMLYYIPDDVSDEDKEKCENVIELLNATKSVFGYELIDMKDQIKNLKNEKHLLDKLNKNEKKK